MLYLGVSTTHEAQLNILQALTRKFKLHPDLKLERVADQCPFHYTGADFYALCADALLKAMSRKAEELEETIGAFGSLACALHAYRLVQPSSMLPRLRTRHTRIPSRRSTTSANLLHRPKPRFLFLKETSTQRYANWYRVSVRKRWTITRGFKDAFRTMPLVEVGDDT